MQALEDAGMEYDWLDEVIGIAFKIIIAVVGVAILVYFKVI